MYRAVQKSLFFFHDKTEKIYKHSTLVTYFLFLAAVLYFVNAHFNTQKEQLNFLALPEKDDVLILDMGHLQTSRQYQAQYRVAQVLQVEDDKITLKQGRFTYRKQRGAERAIKLDALMNNYFRPALLTFKRSELADMHELGTISEVYRPKDIYVMGGIVRHRKQPKSLAPVITFNPYNQEGIRFYQDGNYEQARSSFLKAAEQGDSWGQYNLADMYEYGEGGTQSLEQAYYWYKQATEQNHFKAKEALTVFCQTHARLCR